MSDQTAVLDQMVDDWIGSPSVVFYKLQEALKNPDLSFEDFDSIINTDPSLAARLLRIANSSFYGLDTKVETITHALSIVGIKSVVDIALSTTIANNIKGLSSNLFDMQNFWKHSIACGLAARAIAQSLSKDNLESFYTAGMLHDIGILFMYKTNPKKAEGTLSLCQSKGLPLSQAEDEIFGFNHTKVGALAFKKWGLAPSLIEAVRFHHEPSQAKEYPLEATVLHLADFLVYKMKYNIGENYTVSALDPNLVQKMNMTQSSLSYIRQAVDAQMAETLDIFSA